MAHRTRPSLSKHHPVHVTLRARPHVWNLRSRRSFRVVEAALRGVRDRHDFDVVHFSVQGNHLHLIVEARNASALARGMRAVAIRLAKGLNRLMGTRGAVFEDRHHAHPLTTPREVRNALAYVLLNHRSHHARIGERATGPVHDPYSSAAAFDGWRPEKTASSAAPLSSTAAGRAATLPARTWLLRTGWRRHGLLSFDEVPAARSGRSG